MSVDATTAPKPTISTMRFVWALVKLYPWPYIGYTIAWGAFSLLELLPGLLQQRIFDRLTGDAPVAWGIWTLLAMISVVEVTRVVARYWTLRSDMAFQEPLRALLQRNLMESVYRQPAAQPLPIAAGEVVSRFGDDVAEVKDFPIWLPDMFGKFLFALGAVIIMARINLPMTLVAVLPGVASLWLAKFAWSHMLRAFETSALARDAVKGFLGEIFGAVQAIKVADAEENVINHFHGINANRRKEELRVKLFRNIADSTSVQVTHLGIGLVLLLAGLGIRDGSFTIGNFALFMSYIWSITWFIRDCGTFIGDYQTQAISLARLEELAQGPVAETILPVQPVYLKTDPPPLPALVATDQDALHSLTVHNLTYRHPESGRGIAGISFTLQPGTVTVITGAIGAGKSTLLRTLLGLLPKAAGEIRWNGQLVTDPATFFVPPRVAYTPQVPRLYSESLRDNILMGEVADSHALEWAIRAAVLEADIDQLEAGLATMVGPRGVKLSGGQIQRAAAARMLVRAPGAPGPLLIFDDLSSALDIETERLLWERLFAGKWGASTGNGHSNGQGLLTCLVVSHRSLLLQRADQVIVLENGNMVAK